MPDNAREKPILFSGPMIRAILAGRKTMTRRILKPQPAMCGSVGDRHSFLSDLRLRFAVGDLLWVREAWAQYPIELNPQPEDIWYKADGRSPPSAAKVHRWRSPIHMPRWASRITLRVTAVRVERLQEISEEDAQAEGIYWSEESEGWTSGRNGHEFCDFHGAWATFSFRKLWNSLHGPDAWDANPWVSVTSFERVGMEVVDA